jgi:hypothetical protein
MVVVHSNPYGPGVDCYEQGMNVHRTFSYSLDKYLLFKKSDSTYKIFFMAPTSVMFTILLLL